jgi:cellulose synthase/poly-beta-1,6-N-acetylglucosamine synthase-like glycosyltransferase
MSNLSVSILIPTYKDVRALELILDALQYQTYKNFEVVIAEDDNSEETKMFLDSYKAIFPIKHFYHENSGNRKAVILNKSLAAIKSDYLIFIDGDIIPYSTFIESHVQLAKPKRILCGRRVNLGDKISKDLREGKITAYKFEKNYIKLFKYLNNDSIRHYEQGFYFKANSIVQKIISRLDKNIHIVGSNFSCYREDLFAINGFDEDIVGGSKDDVDIEWRMVASGCELKSVKFCANCFHLNHSRSSRIDDERIAKAQMEQNKRKGLYKAVHGIEENI